VVFQFFRAKLLLWGRGIVVLGPDRDDYQNLIESKFSLEGPGGGRVSIVNENASLKRLPQLNGS